MPLNKLDVKVSPTDKDRNWIVLESITFYGITVPRDFVSDGASIPIGLRWRFPHGGRKFYAAVVHDYCYRTGILSREIADKFFLKAMRINGVSSRDAKLMYWAVRVAGSSSYKGDK